MLWLPYAKKHISFAHKINGFKQIKMIVATDINEGIDENQYEFMIKAVKESEIRSTSLM